MKSRKVFPIIALFCFVFFGGSGTLLAEPAYIGISLPVAVLNLDIPHPGDHSFAHTITMHIDSNVNYRIEITMPEVLSHTSDTSTIVRSDFQMIPLGVLPETGGSEVEVKADVGFNITTTGSERAGQYRGTLIITAMPEP